MHLSPTSKLGYLSFKAHKRFTVNPSISKYGRVVKDPTTFSTEVVWPTKRDSEPVTVCVSHTPFI